jgi:hypothetical protein
MKHASFATRCDRTRGTVFSTFASFNANHVGAHIRQDHAAVRCGDIATEIDHTNALQWCRHQFPAFRL